MFVQPSTTTVLDDGLARLFDNMFVPVINIKQNWPLVPLIKDNTESRQQLFLWTYKRLKELDFFNASILSNAYREGIEYLNYFSISKDVMITRYQAEEDASGVNTPVLLYIRSDASNHCQQFDEIWSSDKHSGKITDMIRNRFDIRVRTYTVPTNKELGPSTPIIVQCFNQWFPMLVLLRGKEWNLAMSQPLNPTSFNNLDAIEVYNGKFNANGFLQYVPEYGANPTDVIAWLTKASQRQSIKQQSETVTFNKAGATGLIDPTDVTTTTQQDEETEDNNEPEEVVLSGRSVIGILTDIRDDFDELIELLRKEKS